MIIRREESFPGAAEGRLAHRRRLKLSITGSTPASGKIDATILDLSVTGMLLRSSAAITLGERISVEVAGYPPFDAVVAWRTGQCFGCKFPVPISRAVLSAALLQSEHSLDSSPAGRGSGVQSHGAAYGERRSLSCTKKLLIVLSLSLIGWAIVGAVVTALIVWWD